jgi:putative Holliday junction resolvase
MTKNTKVNAVILIIGNEILSGRTQDTNTSTIALWLNSIGVKVKEVRVIPDIQKIIIENAIMGIVVGHPINMDGSEGKSSQSASDFCKNLSNNIKIPITMWDERLSSEGSFKITKELGTNTSNRVKNLDKNAAAFILQGAIDYLSN